MTNSHTYTAYLPEVLSSDTIYLVFNNNNNNKNHKAGPRPRRKYRLERQSKRQDQIQVQQRLLECSDEEFKLTVNNI